MSAKMISEVCRMIGEDMEADVKRFDGQPLTGRLAAQMHAELAATIAALAAMVANLDERIDAHAENAPHIYADGSTS